MKIKYPIYASAITMVGLIMSLWIYHNLSMEKHLSPGKLRLKKQYRVNLLKDKGVSLFAKNTLYSFFDEFNRHDRRSLLAFDLDKNKIKWETTIIDKYAWAGGRLIFSNGKIFFYMSSYALYAFDAKTGKILWRYSAGREPETSVGCPFCVSNQTVYFPTADSFRAVDVRTGKLRWRFPAGRDGSVPDPKVDNGVAYFSDSNAVVYALRASDGTLLWKTDIKLSEKTLIEYESSIHYISYPAIQDGAVVVAGRDQYLYWLDQYTGKIIRKLYLGEWLWYPPIGINGKICFVCAAWGEPFRRRPIPDIYAYQAVCAIAQEDGRLLWKWNGNETIGSQLIVYREYIVFRTYDDVVHCIDSNTGKEAWSFDTKEKDSYAFLFVDHGRLVVVTDEGNVYVFE